MDGRRQNYIPPTSSGDKKWGQPGFEPIIYISGAMLTNHTTTAESTISLSYQWIIIAGTKSITHDPS